MHRHFDFRRAIIYRIETSIFDRQQDLFHTSVDVVFYDVTTFHFESNRANDLQEFGFSKSGTLCGDNSQSQDNTDRLRSVEYKQKTSRKMRGFFV